MSLCIASEILQETTLALKELISSFILIRVRIKIKLGNEFYTCTNTSYVKGDRAVLKFDVGSGVSGKAFGEDKIIVKNGYRLENEFADLDSLSCYGNVKSFAFIPLHNLYGQKVGVLQLFNKKEKDIDGGDIKLFKSIQGIYGQLAENIMEFNDALDFYINARNVANNIAQQTSLNDSQLLVSFPL
eukprot:TRINITY_DN3891_c0_g1_i3.p1 TRINITY_DN3891_c0_g1~~TRINITY_DN3891_c0_g1_i3.p1  ORF type:complete len:186 (+),score=26.07 TRINITY_DN3891_c0_g1_i3:1295-1852(+)